MLYLNLSGHSIFKKEVWHLTGKTLPNSNALPPFFKETREIEDNLNKTAIAVMIVSRPVFFMN